MWPDYYEPEDDVMRQQFNVPKTVPMTGAREGETSLRISFTAEQLDEKCPISWEARDRIAKGDPTEADEVEYRARIMAARELKYGAPRPDDEEQEL